MQLNQEQTQKAQANIAAASSYIEAQKSLTQMIVSGASSSEIDTATKKLKNGGVVIGGNIEPGRNKREVILKAAE